ncbi:MAG: ATP-binding cassette domain-containing protein [Bacillota bacterium]
MSSETILEVKDLYYRYPRTDRYVLEEIDLTIKKGEFLVITGENGAGKTTLSLLLTGIIPQAQGGKMFGDVMVCGLNTKEHPLSILSQRIGIVLEDPETQLFTTNVYDEVVFGAENLEMPKEEIIERANWALKTVGMIGYEDRHPTMLSGGQKQRVAIAAALTMKPDILILDEPTSQLDPIGTHEVFEVVRDLKELYGITIIMVTHQSEETAYFADKVLVLSEGKVLAYGTPKQIYSNREITEKAWLAVPQVSELHLELQKAGLPLGEFPIVMEDGVRQIKKSFLDRGVECNV